MLDPYVQQSQASMHMSPWQGFTSNPNMMSGGPQGYMGTGSMSNMQNQFGGLQSGVGTSAYGAMYDNPFTTAFAMERSNILARPRGAQHAGFQAHADNISMGTGAAITSTSMEIGAGIAGSAAGAMAGSAFGPIGTIVGGMAGGMLGTAMGETAGAAYSNRAGRQMETHRSLMGLSNPNSPYGGGFGYGKEDTKDIFRGMEKMASDDPAMSMGDIGRILDEGIKSGNIKGGSSSGDIKSKLKGLKETAKSLVEIFGDSDISEIMDTLRRLNGTGMSNAQATDTSRGIGMAARSLGMKEGDLFNKVSQDAEMKSAAGRETAASSLVMDPAKLLAFKYSKEAQDKFQGNDDFVKKLHATEDKHAQIMSGKSGALMLTKHGETTTSGMMVIAEAQAIHDAGGREEFGNMSRGEQRKARSKALDKVYKEQEDGNLMGLATALSKDKSLTVSDYTALLSGDQAALTRKAEPTSADFTQNKSFVQKASESFGRVMAKAYKDDMVQYYAGVSVGSTDKDVGDTIMTAGGSKYQSMKAQDENQTASAATRTAGAFDSRWKAMLTSLTAAFGQFTEDVVSKAKDSMSGGMQGTSVSSGKQASNIAVGVGSSVMAAEMHSKAGSRQSYKDMITTGDTGTSVFNGMSWVANQNDQLVNGVGQLAGIQKGSLGVQTQQEVVAMAKSQQFSSEKILADTANIGELFKGYEEGDITIDALRTELSEMGGSSKEDLAKFTKDTKQGGGKNINRDIQQKYGTLIDEGLVTAYSASLMQDSSKTTTLERGEDLVDSVLSFANIDHSPRDKSTIRPEVRKQLKSMETLNTAGQKQQAMVVSALEGFEQIDFKELNASIDEFGVREGVDEYLTTSGISDDIGKDGAFRLGKSLKGAKGDEKQTMKHLQQSFVEARAMKSAGTNVNSALNVLGFQVEGTMTSQQITELGEEFKFAGTKARLHENEGIGTDLREKGFTETIMKRMNMTREDALKYQHDVGDTLINNADAMAVYSQAPMEQISRMFQGDMSSDQGKFQKNLMGNADAMQAATDMLDYTPERRADIFKAAQSLEGITGGSDDAVLFEKPTIKEWREKNSNLSDGDIDKAVAISKVKGIKGIKDVDFEKSTLGGATVEKALDASRHILGKGLQTKNEQASALGLLATFKKDENGDFKAMSGLETKDLHTQALAKDEKDRTYRDRLIINSAETVASRIDGLDAKDVSGDQIRSQNKVTLGISGMSDSSIADKMNGSATSIVTDLLSRINENLANLVRMAANPKGDAKKVVSDDDTVNKTAKVTSIDLDNSKDPNQRIAVIGTDVKVDERKAMKSTPKGSEPATSATPEAGKPAKVDSAKPAMPKEPAVMVTSKPLTKDMIGLKGKRAKVEGMKRNEILAKSDVSMDGLKEDTAKVMHHASRLFKADSKQMVVTSATDNTHDTKGGSHQKHKKGSLHEEGKAFDVSYRQFENTKEARAFGKNMQKELADKYEGGVKVIAEKDHFHIALTPTKKDGGFFETKDAFENAAYGASRSVKDLKVMSVGVNKSAKQEYIDSKTPDIKISDKKKKTTKEVMKKVKAAEKEVEAMYESESKKPIASKSLLGGGGDKVFKGKHLARVSSKVAKVKVTKEKASETTIEEEYASAKASITAQMAKNKKEDRAKGSKKDDVPVGDNVAPDKPLTKREIAKGELLDSMGGKHRENSMSVTDADGKVSPMSKRSKNAPSTMATIDATDADSMEELYKSMDPKEAKKLKATVAKMPTATEDDLSPRMEQLKEQASKDKVAMKDRLMGHMEDGYTTMSDGTPLTEENIDKHVKEQFSGDINTHEMNISSEKDDKIMMSTEDYDKYIKNPKSLDESLSIIEKDKKEYKKDLMAQKDAGTLDIHNVTNPTEKDVDKIVAFTFDDKEKLARKKFQTGGMTFEHGGKSKTVAFDSRDTGKPSSDKLDTATTGRDYKIKGGEKAAQLNMATADSKKAKGDSKRDLSAQTNQLLERIASATEAVRDGLNSAGPAISKT